MPVVRLIRHGQSASNAGEATEHPDTIPLTPLGHAQAALVASCFRRAPARVIFSPFDRAAQTAQPLCERFPDAPVFVWPIQEFTYLAPRRYVGTTRLDRCQAVVEYWQRLDPRYRDGEGAETFVEFWDRVEAFLERLEPLPGTSAIFSHGQFLRGVLLRLLSGPLGVEEAMTRFRSFRTAVAYPNTAMTELAVSRRGTYVGRISAGHLPPEMLST